MALRHSEQIITVPHNAQTMASFQYERIVTVLHYRRIMALNQYELFMTVPSLTVN